MAEVVVDQRRLLKTMRWYDGVVIGLANPGFLLVGLAFSIVYLGGTWALTLWIISAVIGALQAYIYCEPAAMFPDKPGGLSVYAREGWRKHFSLAGPIAVFGYWFAWSSVLAVYGSFIGLLLIGEFFSADSGIATWTWDPIALSAVTSAKLIGIGAILLCFFFNVRGMRPAVGLSYVVAGMMVIPIVVIALGAFVTGDVSNHEVGSNYVAASVEFFGNSPSGFNEFALDHGLALHPRLVDLRARSRRVVRAGVQGHEERHPQSACGDRRDERRPRVPAPDRRRWGRSATT